MWLPSSAPEEKKKKNMADISCLQGGLRGNTWFRKNEAFVKLIKVAVHPESTRGWLQKDNKSGRQEPIKQTFITWSIYSLVRKKNNNKKKRFGFQ